MTNSGRNYGCPHCCIRFADEALNFVGGKLFEGCSLGKPISGEVNISTIGKYFNMYITTLFRVISWLVRQMTRHGAQRETYVSTDQAVEQELRVTAGRL